MSLINATCAAWADVFWARFAFFGRLCPAKFEAGLVTTHMTRSAFRGVFAQGDMYGVMGKGFTGWDDGKWVCSDLSVCGPYVDCVTGVRG